MGAIAPMTPEIVLDFYNWGLGFHCFFAGDAFSGHVQANRQNKSAR